MWGEGKGVISRHVVPCVPIAVNVQSFSEGTGGGEGGGQGGIFSRHVVPCVPIPAKDEPHLLGANSVLDNMNNYSYGNMETEKACRFSMQYSMI